MPGAWPGVCRVRRMVPSRSIVSPSLKVRVATPAGARESSQGSRVGVDRNAQRRRDRARARDVVAVVVGQNDCVSGAARCQALPDDRAEAGVLADLSRSPGPSR